MHHSYIDRLAYLDSPLARRDPRAKVAASVGIVLAFVLVPEGGFGRLGLLLLLVVSVAALSPIALTYLLKRSLVVLPFAGAAAVAMAFGLPGPALWSLGPLRLTEAGLVAGAGVLVKAVGASWVLLVLAATTRFDHLLAALSWFRLPALFLEILAFLYRYLFVVIDEGQRMGRARRARSPGRVRRPLRTASAMIASLASRSYERSQRVYLAMTARGYDGRPKPLTPFPKAPAWIWPELAAIALALGIALWPL